MRSGWPAPPPPPVDGMVGEVVLGEFVAILPQPGSRPRALRPQGLEPLSRIAQKCHQMAAFGNILAQSGSRPRALGPQGLEAPGRMAQKIAIGHAFPCILHGFPCILHGFPLIFIDFLRFFDVFCVVWVATPCDFENLSLLVIFVGGCPL